MIEQFSGLRNDVPDDRFSPGDLTKAVNVDVDDSLKLSRRSGSELMIAGAAHSVWADDCICLYVDGNELKTVNPDLTTTSLRTLTSSNPVSYVRAGDRVYFSNGVDTGVVDDGLVRSWGLAVPGPFAATQGSGNLFAGRYQYAMTFIRRDGQESGTCEAQSIDIDEGGSIIFDNLPVSTDPDVDEKIIYLSSADGSQLFESLVLDNNELTAQITENCTEVTPLDTQYMREALPGRHLALHYGHILVAQDNIIYPSGPFEYELFMPMDFIAMPDAVTMVAPVTNGFYVATKKETGFVSGRTPEEFSYEKKSDVGVVSGSACYAQAHEVGFEGVSESRIVLWTTFDKNVCVGLPEGVIYNVTGKRYTKEISAAESASVIRAVNGSFQYLASL